METERGDCFEVRVEKLAVRLLRGAIADSRRVGETVGVFEAEVYEGVEDYDPVLRSHCRLESGESRPSLNDALSSPGPNSAAK